jgi:hypothetical protein
MSAECPTATKRRYATRAAADRASAELTVYAGGIRMRPYLCACGWWHLTRRHAFNVASRNTPRRSA